MLILMNNATYKFFSPQINESSHVRWLKWS